ncbi:MAG: diguanylate cyclase [Rhodocyclaceae bacterium]|nr:diguanylate cyclase [Rhodocyclaceae bacterium]
MKILIVEDARATLLVISSFVRNFGGHPIAVTTGELAIDAFSREQPDLILLDVVLPDIDGFEVARRIRALEKPGAWTPIIFLSARNADQDIDRGINAGGDDYLCKPISEAVLSAKIRAMQRIIQMRTSLVVLARELDTANQELKRLSASDGLTGIANRRFFDDYLSREWRRARRDNASIALLMCDVDNFKAYNDTYGHQAGDDCLRQIAQTLTHMMERASDVVTRYGGEEFAIILPDTPMEGAAVVSEKIRLAIEALSLPHAGSPQAFISISVGVAAMTPTPQSLLQTLIQSADRALYRAKSKGRNQVCCSGPDLDS